MGSQNNLIKNLELMKTQGVLVKPTTLRLPLDIYERIVYRQIVTGRSENAEVVHLVRFALTVIDKMDRDIADELILKAVSACSGPSEAQPR